MESDVSSRFAFHLVDLRKSFWDLHPKGISPVEEAAHTPIFGDETRRSHLDCDKRS